MARIKFRPRNNQSNDKGEFVIEMIITKDRKRKFITTKIWANIYWNSTQEQFDIIPKPTRKEREFNKNHKANNTALAILRDRAFLVIQELDNGDVDWTLNQFKEKFDNKPKQGNIQIYLSEHIQDLKDTGHIGNAKCYQATLHILQQFDKLFEERLFSEIDYSYVKRFDIWLQKRGCKGNTRRYYFKALRAIWNKAIRDHQALQANYPFSKDGFSVSKLSEETEKRYLPTEYLNTLKEQTSQRASTDFARLLFLFSYYTYGMSFIDMALLKHSNIEKLEQGKYIVYKRQKVINNSDTKSIKIKINPKTEEIISLLCNHQQPLSDYLLPLVTRQKDEPEALYNHIFNRRKRYGKNLKELAKEFKFDVNLTSYVSRHTMAMQLQKNDVPEAVISQVLNHSDLKTTKVYLDKLDVAKIDQAAQVL